MSPRGIDSLRLQLVGQSAELLPYLEDLEVTDILLNGTSGMFVERRGNLEAHLCPFKDGQSLFDLIERLVIPTGKRIDAAQPYLDGSLSDGSRFHVILPPIACDGPLISIRKFRSREEIDIRSFGPLEVSDLLLEHVASKKNILIAGGTGTGKTTLLSQCLDSVEPAERLVAIEETREISSSHPHLVHLEARPPSPDGKGEVSLRSLVKNALRMRPDRIILGECRGEEAFDLLQAMNTGHRGSLCTIHANGPLDALRRLEGLILFSGFAVPLRVVREWISSSIQTILYLERRGRERKVVEIIQLLGMEGDVYRILPRFKPLNS